MRQFGLSFLAIVALSSTVQADRNLIGTASVSTGFSDNILGVPETDDPTDAQVQADLFLNVSPGAMLSFDKRSSFHLLNYVLTTRFFASHSEANSFSNRLEYTGRFFRTPVSTVSVTGGLASGVINALDRTSPLLPDQVTELPQGDVGFLNGQGNVAITQQMNIDWGTSATAGVRVFRRLGVDNAGTNFVLPARVAVTKNFRRHGVGAALTATYNAVVGGAREQPNTVNGGPRAFWRWDISEGWSSFASLGGAVVASAPDFEDALLLPVGGLTLNYNFEQALVSAAYGHGATANVFTGDITANHRFTSRVLWPVPWVDGLAVTAAVGYRRGRFVNVDLDQLTGRTEQFTTSISAAYQLNAFWNITGRLRSNRQLREDSLVGSEFGIARRTFNILATWTWPTSNNNTLQQNGQTQNRVDAQNDAAQIQR